MIEEFIGDVYFKDCGNTDGFFRNLPGYPAFICLHEKYQGNLDFILDGIICLLEAAKTLTPRQKCHDQLFWLVNDHIYKSVDGQAGSEADYFCSKKKAPVLAEFCRN